MNKIPIKVVDGIPVLVRDVAYVRDGSPPQQSFVSANGTRAVLVPIYKAGEASTLTVNDFVRSSMPIIRAAAPKGVDIKLLFDQSVFVSGAITDVIREAAIAAALTGLAIFIFLGSWRSTLVVLVSIPLSILTSLSVLALLGETINVMTLGGLALAVGILVDDATVAIENTYRLMEEGHTFRQSVVEGAAGIAKPALISTLAICSAFVSVLFLTDTPKYLFTPQALAVVFAMLASYLLSRTLVPVMIDILVEPEFNRRFGPKRHHEGERRRDGRQARKEKARAASSASRPGFERGFTKFHRGYLGLVYASIRHPDRDAGDGGSVLVLGGVLFLFVGQDYFPQVDSGQMTLHIRAPSGMRLETDGAAFRCGRKGRQARPCPGKVDLVLQNIGLPAINYNFAFGDGSFVGYNDGQMLIQLKDGVARESTATYTRRLRRNLLRRLPRHDLLLPAVRPDHPDARLRDDHRARRAGDRAPPGQGPRGRQGSSSPSCRRVKGAVDVHLQQIVDAPEFFGDVDREMASEIGINTQQIASALNVSLSGSYQITPSFWTDPKTGIPHQLWVQTPEWRTDTLNAVKTTPIFVSAGTVASDPGVLTLLSSIVQPAPPVRADRRQPPQRRARLRRRANVQDRDLGSVNADMKTIVDAAQKSLPVPDTIVIRGQVESMQNAFFNIGIGLMIAIVAVYLLMVLNYQNWGDPFVVLCALPLVFCGIVMSLFITQTTFSIPSLFGAIMAVGVASANSILLVTFAREHREATGCDAIEAAITAGETRFRPC